MLGKKLPVVPAVMSALLGSEPFESDVDEFY